MINKQIESLISLHVKPASFQTCFSDNVSSPCSHTINFNFLSKAVNPLLCLYKRFYLPNLIWCRILEISGSSFWAVHRSSSEIGCTSRANFSTTMEVKVIAIIQDSLSSVVFIIVTHHINGLVVVFCFLFLGFFVFLVHYIPALVKRYHR